MAADPRFVQALRRLNPGGPPGDGEYIARDAANGRGWNVLERIETLLAAGTHLRALLHGCTGVGKSSEFARWQRHVQGRLVVRVTTDSLDVEHIRWGLVDQLVGEAEERGARRAGELRERVDMIGNAPMEDEEASWASSRLFEDVMESLRIHDPHEDLLILIDGLDLVSEKAIATAFGPRGSLLETDLPPFVATVPHTWAISGGPSARHDAIEAVWHLPPLGVIDEAGNPQEEILDRVVVGLAARLGDPGVFESPDLLHRIALNSGGVPRHAVILLRQALLAASGSPKVRAEHVIEAERELRQDLRHSLGVGGVRRATPQAYLSGAILSYEGSEARFERPHPLLA